VFVGVPTGINRNALSEQFADLAARMEAIGMRSLVVCTMPAGCKPELLSEAGLASLLEHVRRRNQIARATEESARLTPRRKH
jgi:hypothetical protein